MLNNLSLVGRLVADPSLEFVGATGEPKSTFRLAVDRPYKRDGKKVTDFLDCTIWKNQANTIAEFARKGDMIGIVARVQLAEYVKDNKKKSYLEILASTWSFAGGSRKREEDKPAPYPTTSGTSRTYDDQGEYDPFRDSTPMPIDNRLPFD
ncbi:single-stranded DNA-binding protein [Priestia koreensis]|uniref:single-stranded DNA-binding protein n=1 Tax=Priestia koreensis TaxID=284581 RepID=UPI001F5813D4|nr:single-stranded DNA-binding protein [Priestia koreensis]UNL87520.1 single-stranded DNA-binding protein [Priestia koreensis]